jgi:hypothetical protein
MCLVTVLGIVFSLVGDKLITTFVTADGEADQELAPKQPQAFSGSYVWQGTEYA